MRVFHTLPDPASSLQFRHAAVQRYPVLLAPVSRSADGLSGWIRRTAARRSVAEFRRRVSWTVTARADRRSARTIRAGVWSDVRPRAPDRRTLGTAGYLADGLLS